VGFCLIKHRLTFTFTSACVPYSMLSDKNVLVNNSEGHGVTSGNSTTLRTSVSHISGISSLSYFSVGENSVVDTWLFDVKWIRLCNGAVSAAALTCHQVICEDYHVS
jgi:hypothetical protein